MIRDERISVQRLAQEHPKDESRGADTADMTCEGGILIDAMMEDRRAKGRMVGQDDDHLQFVKGRAAEDDRKGKRWEGDLSNVWNGSHTRSLYTCRLIYIILTLGAPRDYSDDRAAASPHGRRSATRRGR